MKPCYLLAATVATLAVGCVTDPELTFSPVTATAEDVAVAAVQPDGGATVHDLQRPGSPIADGTHVVLDDAARSGEQTSLRRWRSIYPGLEVVLHDHAFARGIAILRLGDDRRRRVSIRSILGSIHDRIVDLRRGRPRPPGAPHASPPGDGDRGVLVGGPPSG